MRYIPVFLYIYKNNKKIKKYVCFVLTSNFTGLFTSSKVMNIMFFFCYIIFTNTRVGSIHKYLLTLEL